ncbi:MAG: sialate O-acetylesterase [Adhaeribacter sp.]
MEAQTPDLFRLAHIFGDNMVIQRGVKYPVWGFAAPGTEVRVAFRGAEVRTRADEQGRWLVKLPPMQAGGPHELKVSGSRTLVLKNVMVGEVWLASGQSNMEFTLGNTLSAKEDMASAYYPDIRLFTVPFGVSIAPQQDIKPNTWRTCTSDQARYFSAVAYHFARELHLALQVPVGIINASKGSSPAEAWTSAEVLSAMPEFKDKMLQLQKEAGTWDAKARELQKLQNARAQIVKTAAEGLKQGVNTLGYDDSHWQVKDYPLAMPKLGKPGYWGFVWFRKTIPLKKADIAGPLQLRLPLVAQQRLVYFNGTPIAAANDTARFYTIPQKLLREGKNVLALRLLSYYGKGEVGPENEPAALTSADKKLAIPLDGDWKFHFDIEPRIAGAQHFSQTPSVLYNAMIAPLIPLAVKGVIWYQGEANTTNPGLYESLFPAMIHSWRSAWGQGDFPFAFVQLAGYARPGGEDLKWAHLREVQFKSLKTPHTMLATAIDVGEQKDIHPRNKKEVGRRLALAVRNQVYGEKIQSSGPVFKNFKIKGNTALVAFTQTGTGLTAREGKPLTGFEIAGPDQVFYPAEAAIIQNKVKVYSAKVPRPVAVRYAFHSYPPISLYNQQGLPALPFRTDNWPLE